ncbi:unnamed protein product, partial [Effrenium voratum]
SNAISSVDWAPEDLRHLLFLDMSSNKLSELPQLHMPALRRADFRDNEIVSCAKFSGHASLQTLRLSGNQLSSVQGLQAMPKLEVLELSGNALSSLDVTKLPALASLDISKNKFETLAGPWQEMAALASLDASGNALAEVKALEPLQQMEALRSFAMAGCPLEEQEGLNLRLEILIFRTLQMINGEEVPPEERDEAQALHEKRLEEEAERLRQEEEARLAAEEAAKEGSANLRKPRPGARLGSEVDLEGYQRAWRLRHSADDGLMRQAIRVCQVFGEELAEMQKNQPALLDVARTYFPHLTSSTYEALAREPDNLRVEKDRCEREMEQLAVQNYSAFIGSAEVMQGVKQELSSIQTHLKEMAEILEPTQDTISELQEKAAGLSTRRGALRNVLAQHGQVVELLELPQLLDACVRNQMYEESLELLAFCHSLLQAHDARGEEIGVLTSIKDQVAVQRANLREALASQLKTDIHLPACVRIVGFLRRCMRHSEEELRKLFIEHRSKFLESHKQQVELLRHSRGSVGTALRNAADLLRTHVYDIGTQYKALFPQDDGPLGAWLNSQVMWFVSLLRQHVLPSGPSAKGSALAAKIDAAQLTTVLRQCVHASSTLKRLGGHFFPAVSGIFEARMESYCREMLDAALLTFHAELGRYDWVPSTALSSGESAGWLHPQALELTRHRPLAVLTNDIVQVFNELRQCTLYGLRVSVVTHCYECGMASVNLLRSVLASQSIRPGSPKAAEFHKLCRNFADILMPLVASHLEALFGSFARLDVGAIVGSMVPDLITEYLPEPELSELPEEEPAEAAEADAAEAEAEAADAESRGLACAAGAGGKPFDAVTPQLAAKNRSKRSKDGRAYPEEVNTFYANVLLAPAFFKPIPGGLSDWLRLRGCGRRPFLVLIELLWCISLVFASEARTRGSFFAAFVAVALCCGAAEAVLDGASVELMRNLNLCGAEVQSTAFAFKTAGSLLAFATSPLLLATCSHYTAAKVCAIVPLAAVPVSMFASFPVPASASCGPSRRGRVVSAAALFGACFLFLRGAVPTEGDTFSSFMSTKVSGAWVALTTAGSSVGGLLALLAFQAMPADVTKHLVSTICATTATAVVVGGGVQFFLAAAAPSAAWIYALGATVVGAVDTLFFLPNLAICADCAPKDFGALGFAVLSLVLDLGDQASARIAAQLVEANHLGSGQGRSWAALSRLVLICRLAMLLPLGLLPFLRLLRGMSQGAEARGDEGLPADADLSLAACD